MSQLTGLDRLNNGKNLTENKITIHLKEAIHPFLLMLSKTKIGYKIQKVNSYNFKKDNIRPIIFVCNHTNSKDAPVAMNAIKKHAYLLVGKQPLEKVDETFFNLNGTIFVDRKDKEDAKSSKQSMIEILNKGKNILVFPEGTWNMTDSNLMHEMKWGIIDVAKNSNAIIVPMAIDYDKDVKICKCKFGNEIDVKDLSLNEGIKQVRDAMATLRWDLFEEKGEHKRSSINIEEERKKRMDDVKDYPKLDYEYEKSVVFHSSPTTEEVFEPINRLRK